MVERAQREDTHSFGRAGQRAGNGVDGAIAAGSDNRFIPTLRGAFGKDRKLFSGFCLPDRGDDSMLSQRAIYFDAELFIL
jgi:hypothetical protein